MVARPIRELLNGNLLLGEVHEHISPKKFLIENMKILAEAGVKILFLEHIFYENQHELDVYCAQGKKLFATPPVPPRTAAALSEKDMRMTGSADDRAKYNFTQVVVAARKAGIRVVGIDGYYEYEKYSGKSIGEDGLKANRHASMNFMATEIMRREIHANPHAKWVGLIGDAHLKQLRPGVLGMRELMRTRVVHICDVADPKKVLVASNAPFLLGNAEDARKCLAVAHGKRVDLCMYVLPTSAPYKLNKSHRLDVMAPSIVDVARPVLPPQAPAHLDAMVGHPPTAEFAHGGAGGSVATESKEMRREPGSGVGAIYQKAKWTLIDNDPEEQMLPIPALRSAAYHFADPDNGLMVRSKAFKTLGAEHPSPTLHAAHAVHHSGLRREMKVSNPWMLACETPGLVVSGTRCDASRGMLLGPQDFSRFSGCTGTLPATRPRVAKRSGISDMQVHAWRGEDFDRHVINSASHPLTEKSYIDSLKKFLVDLGHSDIEPPKQHAIKMLLSDYLNTAHLADKPQPHILLTPGETKRGFTLAVKLLNEEPDLASIIQNQIATILHETRNLTRLSKRFDALIASHSNDCATTYITVLKVFIAQLEHVEPAHHNELKRALGVHLENISSAKTGMHVLVSGEVDVGNLHRGISCALALLNAGRPGAEPVPTLRSGPDKPPIAHM
jgi:hypothetical protein